MVAREYGPRRGCFAVFEPQPNRFRNRMAARVRHELGFACLPAGPNLRDSLTPLISRGRQSVIFMIDEKAVDTIRFPLFGLRRRTSSGQFAPRCS